MISSSNISTDYYWGVVAEDTRFQQGCVILQALSDHVASFFSPESCQRHTDDQADSHKSFDFMAPMPRNNDRLGLEEGD